MELEIRNYIIKVEGICDGSVTLSLCGGSERSVPTTLNLAGDEARDLADLLARAGCAVDGLLYGGMVVSEGIDVLEPEEPEDDDFPIYLEYETPGNAGDYWVEQLAEDGW